MQPAHHKYIEHREQLEHPTHQVEVTNTTRKQQQQRQHDNTTTHAVSPSGLH